MVSSTPMKRGKNTQAGACAAISAHDARGDCTPEACPRLPMSPAPRIVALAVALFLSALGSGPVCAGAVPGGRLDWARSTVHAAPAGERTMSATAVLPDVLAAAQTTEEQFLRQI